MDRLLRTLLLSGVKQVGTYDPDEVLDQIYENLTEPETKTVRAFLTWVQDHELTFGHGNIDEVFDAWRASCKHKARRHDALHQHARGVYDHDRDIPGEYSKE